MFKKNIALTFLICTQVTFAMNHDYQKLHESFDDYWNMEEPQTTNPQQSDTPTQLTKSKASAQEIYDAVIHIYTEITQRYPSSNSYFFNIPLTEQNYFGIMDIINKYSDTLNIRILNIIGEKNTAGKKAIEHFVELAFKNINAVTVDTLETIGDHTLPQSVKQLNQLPLTIKKLVMDAAYAKIKQPYDIILSKHTDVIHFFDIDTSTHRAVTIGLDQKVYLWDLTTGKCTHTMLPKTLVHHVKFSKSGSYLAASANYTDNTSDVYVWDIRSVQYLDQKPIHHSTKILRFSDDNMIIACNDKRITVLSIDKDSMNIMGSTSLPGYTIVSDANKCVHWDNLYKTKHPDTCIDDTASNLTVTKINCPPLYLCQKAIENTSSCKKNNIKELALFKSLTQYEKDIINKQLTDK